MWFPCLSSVTNTVAQPQEQSTGWACTSPPEPPAPPPSLCPCPGLAQGAPLPGGVPSRAPDGHGCWLSGQPDTPPARCLVVSPRSSQARSHPAATQKVPHNTSCLSRAAPTLPPSGRMVTRTHPSFRASTGELHRGPQRRRLMRTVTGGSPTPASPPLCKGALRGRGGLSPPQARGQDTRSSVGHHLEAHPPGGSCPPRRLAQRGLPTRGK